MVFSTFLACLLQCFAPSIETERIHLESLLEEMVDLSNLSRFPKPPFSTRQASSYDRASKSPEEKEGWFANSDSGHYLRVDRIKEEESEFVMMDADGPGAIVRIWSANPKGIIRIYLDGNAQPSVEIKMSHMLDGVHSPFLSPLAGVCSNGWNSYFPIPYSKHCRIASTEEGFYYHVNYRTYPPGTRVDTFSLEEAEILKEKIEDVSAVLLKPWEKAPLPLGLKETSKREGKLWPDKALNLSLPGQGAVYRLIVRVSAKTLESALRTCLMEAFFDGENPPAVQCPLGDFFGSAPGFNPFQSLPCGMLEDGTMYSHWVMPFQKGVRLAITNHGKEPVEIQAGLSTGPFDWDERSLRFHAKWKMESHIPTRPFMDWNYLECTGRGTFVGAALNLTNPVKSWWGEGDEKIYVDGEKFPSFFGTGTEDYFGYAWSSTTLFQHAYHNQTRCDGPRSYGHTSLNRFHILDRIPFTKYFRFDMELWHWAETEVSQALTAYWYASSGNKDSFRPLRGLDLAVAFVPPYSPPRLPGAIEGEEMKVLGKPGHTEVQSRSFPDCSNESHLWWTGAKEGDELQLEFDVKKSGEYEISVLFTAGKEYGIFRLKINDQDIDQDFDLYAEKARKTGPISLGNFELRRGQNFITVRIAGKNEGAIPGRFFGLDCLILRELK